VTPATAARFGVSSARLTEPGTNLRVGATLLKTLQARFGNDLPLVLAAYNAGEGAVAAHGGRVPDYPETKAYVATVMRTYRSAVATR
jgi:soluble lytic murein transglycosylase-like protein